MNFFDQADFEVRCEWGLQGVLQLAPISDVVVIVAVLSFSTCIDIVTGRGVIAFPLMQGYEQDVDLALEVNVSHCVPTLVNGAYTNKAR